MLFIRQDSKDYNRGNRDRAGGRHAAQGLRLDLNPGLCRKELSPIWSAHLTSEPPVSHRVVPIDQRELIGP